MIRNLIFVVCIILLLSACAPAASATQVNISQVQTEAVAVYQASLPTNTPVVLPTLAQTVAAVPPLSPTSTSYPTPAPIPTVVSIPPVASSGGIQYYAGDHARFSSQTPGDWPVLEPSSHIAVSWTLLNDGSTTWGSGYSFQYVGGTKVWGNDHVTLMSVVAPGETGSAAIDVFAPEKEGSYVTYWALFNADGKQIFRVYFAFSVK